MQGTAKSAEHRLRFRKASLRHLTGLQRSTIMKKFNLDKKYKVIVPDKKGWEKSPPIRVEYDVETGSMYVWKKA